jgi:hypothetical protein
VGYLVDFEYSFQTCYVFAFTDIYELVINMTVTKVAVAYDHPYELLILTFT